jgi:uncharacterized protein (TIGR02265 family)
MDHFPESPYNSGRMKNALQMSDVSSSFSESDVVFEQTVRALFHDGLKGGVTAQLKTKLKRAGLDLEKKLLPAYSRNAWNEYLRIAAREIHPKLPEAEAFERLAQATVEAGFQTLLGKALAPMLRLVGPRRMLARTQQNMRNGNNYTVAKYQEVSPSSADVWMNEVGLSRHYMLGVLRTASRFLGVSNVIVTVTAHDEAGCTYRIAWT